MSSFDATEQQVMPDFSDISECEDDDIDITTLPGPATSYPPKTKRPRSKSPPPKKHNKDHTVRSRSPTPIPPKKRRSSPSPPHKKDAKESHRRRERSRSPDKPYRARSRSRSRDRQIEVARQEVLRRGIIKQDSGGHRRHTSSPKKSPRVSFHSDTKSSSSSSSWKTTSIKASKPNGPAVVILTANSQDEQRWKPIFHRHRFQIFDYNYPFRIATKTILRQNAGYRQASMFSTLDSEKLSTFLAQQTADYMTGNYKSNFVFDYFDDWFQKIPKHQQDRVVICGFGQDYAFKTAIKKLRDLGAVQISSVDMPSGDANISSVGELEDFIQSIVTVNLK